MNTQITSELFLLNKMQNDPIVYQGKDRPRDQKAAAETTEETYSWLQKFVDWLQGDVDRSMSTAQ